MRRQTGNEALSICLVIFHAFPEIGGGEERFLKYFSDFLKNKKIRFSIVSSIGRSNNPSVVGVGIRRFRLPLIGFTPYSLLFSVIAGIKIISMNKRRHFSLIHSMDTGYAGLAGLFANKILGLEFVVHSHCSRARLLKLILLLKRGFARYLVSPYEKFESSIDTFVSRNADVIIAVSNEIGHYIESLGVPREKIVVSPIGLDVTSFKPEMKDRREIRDELKISSDAFVLGYIGRIEITNKRIDVLVKAFSLFRNQADVNSCLLMVGNDGHKKLEKMVRRMKLSSVIVLGFRRDVKRILAGIDVFVLPSLSEGCPFSLLEAMAAEKAIIASDIPGIREVVEDGKEALLFDPKDVHMLEQAFLRLYYDRELSQRLGKNAKRKVRLYDIGVVSNKTIKIYREFMS